MLESINQLPDISYNSAFDFYQRFKIMPIYDYQCSECGHQDEVMRKVSDANTMVCPQCMKETFSKMLSAPSFQLSGTGWYATDFKNSGTPKPVAEKKEEQSAETPPAKCNPGCGCH